MALKRTLIGMLTPSSNTVLEPYMCAMLSGLLPDVTAHFQRFTVREISLGEKAMAQFRNDPLLEAARTLNDARMDVIAWAGTAAGWRGFEVDINLCAEITKETGAPATTSVLALNEILDRTGAKRVGLVTPYLKEVQDQIIANYASAGHEITTERHCGDKGNFSFSEYDEETIAGMIRDVARDKPDAIVVLCTNFRGAPIAEALERELGIPIYDSVSATVWKALVMTGHDPARIKGWGRLFAELR
jgi:maleate isomerase